MNKSANNTIAMPTKGGPVLPRVTDAVIDDSQPGEDFRGGLEAMQISADGRPAVVLVKENDGIRYYCATEMSTAELRALVTDAAAGLAMVDDLEGATA